MARSVGEAISNGIDAGLRLYMDLSDRQDAKTRQAKLDAQAEAGLRRAQERQDQADVLSSIGEQEKMLATEGQGLANRPVPPTPEEQQDFTERSQGLRARKSQVLAKRSGFDVAAAQRDGQQDIEKIKAGDFSNLKPGQFTRGITVGTGRPPTDYLRQGDQPSPVEVAAGDFIEGLQGDDQPRMLKGLNSMFAPELRKGVGQPGRHGGTIIAKEIVDLHPDPRAGEDDPHVIPMLRVYVTGGTPLRGPLPPGVPEGATGYYDAPLTKGRGSDPKDTVKSIGIKDAQAFIDNQVKLVESMNTPQAQQQLQLDAQAGDFDPNQYVQALASLGIAPTPKEVIDEKVVPANAVLISTRKNARTGQVLGRERIEGNKKSETVLEMAERLSKENGTTVQEELRGLKPPSRPTLFQEAQDYAEANGITVQEALTIMQRGGVTKRAAGDGAAAGGPGLKEREQRRKELKDLNESDSRDEANARNDLARFDERMAKAPLSQRKDPANTAERARLSSRLESITTRIDDRKRKIDKTLEEDAGGPGLGSTSSAGGSKPKAAGKVLKFDKNGNRIP